MLWRLTRNRYARSVYNRLMAAGVTATQLYEYERTLPASTATDRSTEGEWIIETLPPAAVRTGQYDIDFSIPVSLSSEDVVVLAVVDGSAVGRTVVSATPSHYVDPLQREIAVPGAYVRRVFVDRNWRERGVATRLLGRALDVAHEQLDQQRAMALIAADNRPSQRLFERLDFERVGTRTYAKAGPFEWYWERCGPSDWVRSTR